MPSAFINLFDFRTVFLDYLLGAPSLIALAILLAIAFASAYFQMSPKIFGIILVISSIAFSFYIGQAIFFIILLLVGFISFRAFARFFA